MIAENQKLASSLEKMRLKEPNRERATVEHFKASAEFTPIVDAEY